MADSKITALAALTAADPVNDMFPVVDVSDTSMAASGTTKRISVNNILSSSPTASGALTVTGLVTAGSATITGAATVGTTLGVTGQLSTANVLKTTGNPSLGTAGATEAFVAHNTGYGAILYGQGTTCDAALLDRNTGLRLSVTTSGAQVSGDLSVTSGNVVMSTSGKGIDFSAVTGGTGTATANVLNDYEEGTWVPVVADAATGGNVGTYSNNGSTYTKIGRQVSIQTYISAINTTGMTGGNALRIRGLPFTSVRGGNGNFYTYRVGRNASTVSSSVQLADGSTALSFPLYTTNSATADLIILVSDIVSGTSEIILSVTYFA
jgi:hypothetical protein